MPSLQHLPRHTPADEIWRVLDEDGGLIIDNFLSAETLKQLQVDVMPAIDQHHTGTDQGRSFVKAFHGDTTKRLTGLANISRAWVEILCDPLYRAMADHYLGENNYYLNTGQLICIGPGETPQVLHRDEQNWPAAAGQPAEITVSAIFALTDFTEANGATVVAPGSQRWPGAMPEVNKADTCPATMSAGSALLYSGKVLHGGGGNTSPDQWRIGLHASLVLGWLRSEENHQLTTSTETARGLPEYAQRMLGFRSYNPPKAGRLGLVDFEDAGLLMD
jgi:hypothetical protein